MSFEKDYNNLYNSVQKLAHYEGQLDKQASLLGFAGALAAGEAMMKGIAQVGKAHDANFLRAGVELGRQGQKMNPYTENISRNVLGNKQLAPYDAGLEIGKRMQARGMDPETESRFLDKIVGMGSARKDRLVLEGKKVKDPVLNSLENYQIGRDLKNPKINDLLLKGSRPINDNRISQEIASNAASLPGVFLDSRTIIRPALRTAEKHPKVQELSARALPENSKRKKVYTTVRDYID